MPDEPIFDRATELRTDRAALEALERRGDARFLFCWRSRNLVTRDRPAQPIYLDGDTASPFRERANDAVFLGLQGETPLFAMSLPGGEDSAALAEGIGDFNDLRMIGPFMDDVDARLLAYARGVLHWHRHHRHCGKCGAATSSDEGGHVRVCSGCEKRHFPRTDPAIMALITRGDRVLLARQAKWPPSMYSILAGFVEPGENIEDAVVREVREEVGLEVSDIAYVRSQPWPFPASLMIGYTMISSSGDIELRDQELEEAKWVTRDEITNETHPLYVPPKFSLAGQLIERWIQTS